MGVVVPLLLVLLATGAESLGALRSAAALLRAGDLAALAAAHADVPASTFRLNGRTVHLLSTAQLAKQVCVEQASVFADRNDPTTHEYGLVAAVGDEWTTNRAVLRAALVGPAASAEHGALARRMCNRPEFRDALARAGGEVGAAAPLVRALAANTVAEAVLGVPPEAARRTIWRPLASADRAARPPPPLRPLARRLARGLALARVLAEQALALARPSPFFTFAKAFTAPRAVRVARHAAAVARWLRRPARDALTPAEPSGPPPRVESDRELVALALAGARAHGCAGGVLGALLRSGRAPDSPGLAELCEELLVAGSATTATAALSALAALCADPELGEAARGVAASARADPLAPAPLLGACVREGMRLNPPAPLIFRIARAPTTLRPAAAASSGGDGGVLAVEAGTAVMMSAAVLADERGVWSQPSRFLPDRWLGRGASDSDAGEGPRSGDALASLKIEMSFGAGPRSCVGAGFAMSVAPVILAFALLD